MYALLQLNLVFNNRLRKVLFELICGGERSELYLRNTTIKNEKCVGCELGLQMRLRIGVITVLQCLFF